MSPARRVSSLPKLPAEESNPVPLVKSQVLIQIQLAGNGTTWGDRRDLNPQRKGHNLECYRYTTITVGCRGIEPLLGA